MRGLIIDILTTLETAYLYDDNPNLETYFNLFKGFKFESFFSFCLNKDLFKRNVEKYFNIIRCVPQTSRSISFLNFDGEIEKYKQFKLIVSNPNRIYNPFFHGRIIKDALINLNLGIKDSFSYLSNRGGGTFSLKRANEIKSRLKSEVDLDVEIFPAEFLGGIA